MDSRAERKDLSVGTVLIDLGREL